MGIGASVVEHIASKAPTAAEDISAASKDVAGVQRVAVHGWRNDLEVNQQFINALDLQISAAVRNNWDRLGYYN